MNDPLSPKHQNSHPPVYTIGERGSWTVVCLFLCLSPEGKPVISSHSCGSQNKSLGLPI